MRVIAEVPEREEEDVRMRLTIVATAVLFVLAACTHATPITQSPLPAEEVSKLRGVLVGTCAVTATQKAGGEQKRAEGLSWTFLPNGHGSYLAAALGVRAQVPFTYRLDGRNLLMDGPYNAIRVDGFDGPTMRWFIYDTSETYYCTKL